MVRWLSLVIILLVTLPASAEVLPETVFEYLGEYELPKREAPGKTGTYTYNQGALDYVPDCMGRVDPTPDDGFPGCMLMRGHNTAKGVIGLTDIPAPGGQAQTVIPLWDTGIKEFAAEAFPEQIGFTNLVNSFGVAYQQEPCAIWISFLPYYASTRYEDTPYLWKLSCDPSNPNPQGGWGNPVVRDAYGRNMGHLNKYGWQFELMSAENCERIFGIAGECVLLGSGKGSGSRESSAGPAWAAVKLPSLQTVPLVEDFTPAIYYHHPVNGGPGSGKYVRFWEQSPYKYTMFHHCNRARGGSYLQTADGEAFVQLISEPIPNPPGYYPNTPEGRARYDNDPNTPQSTDPVGYYGINECNETSAEQQQPSFWDTKRDGSQADVDCDLEVICPNNSTGPRCSLRQFWMLLYDPADIAAAASGAVDHWVPQPYGKVLLEGIDPFNCPNDNIGDTAFDGVHVYLTQSTGPDPRVHVYRVGEGAPPPDKACDVAAGDNCQTDPANCGECPPCLWSWENPTQNTILLQCGETP